MQFQENDIYDYNKNNKEHQIIDGHAKILEKIIEEGSEYIV